MRVNIPQGAPRVRVPTMTREAMTALVSMGARCLAASEVQAVLASSTRPMDGLASDVPPEVVAIAAAVGLVANRVLQAVDEELKPLIPPGAQGTASVPVESMPLFCRRILAAVGFAAEMGLPVEEGPPEEEPIETRAARSGLVIAS